MTNGDNNMKIPAQQVDWIGHMFLTVGSSRKNALVQNGLWYIPVLRRKCLAVLLTDKLAYSVSFKHIKNQTNL